MPVLHEVTHLNKVNLKDIEKKTGHYQFNNVIEEKLVRRIIEIHNGKICVDIEADKSNTNIIFTLPLQ